jgi:hypothetical protein
MRLLTVSLLTLFALSQLAARAGQNQTGGQPQAPGAGQASATDEVGALDRRVRELYDAKKYEEAAAQAQAAVDAAARRFGEGSKEVSERLSALANVYLARHDTGKARKALARMLELREKRPGPSEQFEQDALERYTCLIAADRPAGADADFLKRISRVLIEDSVLAQGFRLSPDRKELQVGTATSKPQPYYPTEAKATHTSGSAVLLISVDETGKVTDVAPLDCSSKIFTQAGATAAYHTTFNPTLVGGKPVKMRSIIFYRWVIF